VNYATNFFTRADDQYLMTIYASIDFFTALTIVFFGDRHVLYQLSLLATMIAFHGMLELDQILGTSVIFDWYVYSISAIVLAQIAGARSGMDRGVLRLSLDRFEINHPYRSYHQESIFSKENKPWQR